MHRELFDDAIGEAPRSTVDVDAVITRGRRAARVRRVANPAVAAGVAVVALVGAITLTMGGDDGGGVPVGQPPSPTKTSPSYGVPTDVATPAWCVSADLESVSAINHRLTQAATEAFQARLPGARLDTNPMSEYPDGVQHGPFEFFQATPGDTINDAPVCGGEKVYFLSRASVHTEAGDGSMLVYLQPVYVPSKSIVNCGDGLVYCAVVDGPQGERIVKSSHVAEGGVTENRVDVTRADGTYVTITAQNIGTDVKVGGPPTSPAPPLDLDQLATMALEPGMTLAP
ncbi:hypothetical protein [Actinophytocola oryzae]|nr:hypothetical protein [Actinophytocola oryzae]